MRVHTRFEDMRLGVGPVGYFAMMNSRALW
jgi:hypothetical protein